MRKGESRTELAKQAHMLGQLIWDFKGATAFANDRLNGIRAPQAVSAWLIGEGPYNVFDYSPGVSKGSGNRSVKFRSDVGPVICSHGLYGAFEWVHNPVLEIVQTELEDLGRAGFSFCVEGESSVQRFPLGCLKLRLDKDKPYHILLERPLEYEGVTCGGRDTTIFFKRDFVPSPGGAPLFWVEDAQGQALSRDTTARLFWLNVGGETGFNAADLEVRSVLADIKEGGYDDAFTANNASRRLQDALFEQHGYDPIERWQDSVSRSAQTLQGYSSVMLAAEAFLRHQGAEKEYVEVFEGVRSFFGLPDSDPQCVEAVVREQSWLAQWLSVDSIISLKHVPGLSSKTALLWSDVSVDGDPDPKAGILRRLLEAERPDAVFDPTVVKQNASTLIFDRPNPDDVPSVWTVDAIRSRVQEPLQRVYKSLEKIEIESNDLQVRSFAARARKGIKNVVTLCEAVSGYDDPQPDTPRIGKRVYRKTQEGLRTATTFLRAAWYNCAYSENSVVSTEYGAEIEPHPANPMIDGFFNHTVQINLVGCLESFSRVLGQYKRVKVLRRSLDENAAGLDL